MAWKAKENVLHFQKGDVVDEIQDNWKPHFEELKAEKKVEVKTKTVKKAVKKSSSKR